MLKKALQSVANGAGRVPVVRTVARRATAFGRGGAVAFLRMRRIAEGTVPGDDNAPTVMQLDAFFEASHSQIEFIAMPEALSLLARGKRLVARDRLRVVLTFDESFSATTRLALPLCKAHHVPFTVFVTTCHLDDDTTLWDEAVRAFIDAYAPTPLFVRFVDRPLLTATAADRAQTSRLLLLSLASLDETEWRARLTELFALRGGTAPSPRAHAMLSSHDIRTLSQEPLVTFGAHGHTHQALASLTDDALRAELDEPQQRLRALAKSAFVDVMSYPFGRPPYIDDRVVRAAREAGYRAAFTAQQGVARPGDHVFRLPRALWSTWPMPGASTLIGELSSWFSGEAEKMSSLDG
jgi:peptidoglycan/xylan/chitin deacetylase (PgdA/CDA1 family)